jgi:hypothetical protein
MREKLTSHETDRSCRMPRRAQPLRSTRELAQAVADDGFRPDLVLSVFAIEDHAGRR